MTHLRPRSTTDWLFVLQLGGAVGLITPQVIRHWTEVAGISMTFLVSLFAFAVLQYSLARSAYHNEPTRKTWQARFIFALWTILIGFNIGEILILGMYRWDLIDVTVLPLLLISMILVCAYARYRKRMLTHPSTLGQLAVVTRGIPQIFQGIKFVMVGGAGFSGTAILVGNINIWIRLTHLFLTRQESKKDLNRRWMLISECINAVTWLLTSLTWLCWYIGWITP